MPAKASTIDTVASAFIWVNRFVIGLFMMIMAGLVFTNVVLRYAFGFSIGWAEEVSRYLMISVAFLGAGLALRQGSLIAVDLLQDALPAAAARIVRTIIVVIAFAFLAVVIYYGFAYALQFWNNKTPVLRISQGIPYLAVPVGGVLMALHLIFGLREFMARDWLTVGSLDEDDTEDFLADDLRETPDAPAKTDGEPDRGSDRP